MAKHLLALLSFVLAAANCMAQQENPFMNDANGRPLYLKTDYRAEGSPYFTDGYHLSEITTTSGIVYYNVKSRFNILENQLEYLTDDGKAMVATSPISKVRFLKMPDENGKLSNVSLTGGGEAINAAQSAVYELLDSGKVSLLKKITIRYRDEKKYGDAVTTRIFERKELYYAMLQNKEVKKMEKGTGFMLNLLADKKGPIASFIEKNSLKCKGTKEYLLVFSYYNSL